MVLEKRRRTEGAEERSERETGNMKKECKKWKKLGKGELER